MTEIYQGETLSLNYEFKNKAGAYFDPDTTAIKIINPAGASVATPSLTKIAAGKYELNYTLASDAPIGVWKVFMTAVASTYTEKDLQVFEVVTTL